MIQKDWKGCLAHMDITISSMGNIVVMVIMFLVSACLVLADETSEVAVKVSEYKELKIPYAFYNDSFGAAVGYVYGGTGYPQPQSTVLATAIAGSNRALAFYLLSRDIRLPFTERLFFDTDLAMSTFGTIQSYISGNPDFPDERAGSNGSDKDNFVEGDGDDNLVRVNFKYLLPMGGGRDMTRPPALDRGLPMEDAGERISWDPLVSGKTFIEVKPYWRIQTIDTEYGTFDQKTNGAAFSLYRGQHRFPKESLGRELRAPEVHPGLGMVRQLAPLLCG